MTGVFTKDTLLHSDSAALSECPDDLRSDLVRTLEYYERCMVAGPADGDEVYSWHVIDEETPSLGMMIVLEYESGHRQLNQVERLPMSESGGVKKLNSIGWKVPLINPKPRRWAYAKYLTPAKRHPLVTLHGVFNADELRAEIELLEVQTL